MESYSQEERYLKATKRIKKLKEFYIHLSVYIIFNTASLMLIYTGYDVKINFWRVGPFVTPFWWGLGLAVHALIVFGPHLSFLKHWEEKKLDQFIKEEEQQNNQWE